VADLDAGIQRLLARLQDAGFEFAVIGGVAAIAHGASTLTRDLDLAAPMTTENLARLLDALRPLHPRHVLRPDLGELVDPPERLATYRLLMLTTDLGRVDIIREVRPVGEYADLETVEMELVEHRVFKVLALDQLIDVKGALSRPKDRAVEAEPRAIRDVLRDSM
jgi:hypothetical protein